MKVTQLLSTVLLGSFSPVSALVLPRDDASTIANFGRIGICLSYFGAGDTQKELAPCSIFCPAQNPGSDPNAVGVCAPTPYLPIPTHQPLTPLIPLVLGSS